MNGPCLSVLVGALVLATTGCDVPHGHEHDTPHAHDGSGHPPHTDTKAGADHGHEHNAPQAHDNHDRSPRADSAGKPQSDHGHDHATPHEHDHNGQAAHTKDEPRTAGGHDHEPGAIAVTHFTDRTELFVEYPPLAVGESSAFAAHLTTLDNFQPVAEGRLTVRLSGGGSPVETFSVEAPATPGIFRPVARPTHFGERKLELVLETPNLSVTHELGEVTVYPNEKSAAAARVHEEESDDQISFLKEQQWKVDFATAEVQRQSLRASIIATGTIKARSDGEALVSAPTAGHLQPGEAFPRIGTRVSPGDALAIIEPRVAGEVDVTSLELAVQRARLTLDLAMRDRKRVADLVSEQAAPQKRLNEAESSARVARAELDAATQRLAQYQRTLGTGIGGKAVGVTVRAPIGGTLAEIRVAAGSFVEEGQAMFHIVATDRLWLEAKVAEADLGRLGEPTGAWFDVEGYEETFEIDPRAGGKLVAFGNVVDPVSRTAPVVFEFVNAHERLRVGMFAQVHIWTDESAEAPAVPVDAVVEETGQDVVYVMRGGESFERRVVRLGIREGGLIGVRSGVEAGERVVTRGAYLVRLAAASPAAAGHGHAH